MASPQRARPNHASGETCRLFRETWQQQLAIADRLMVEARNSVDGHKANLCDLERSGQDSSRARMLLALLAEALGVMRNHRAPSAKARGVRRPKRGPAQTARSGARDRVKTGKPFAATCSRVRAAAGAVLSTVSASRSTTGRRSSPLYQGLSTGT